MSLAWHIRLAGQAEKDLLDITRWTVENFGTRQAEHYAETIALAIEALHDGPEILGAKVRDDIGMEIRTLHVARQGRKGRHFIAFSVSEGHIAYSGERDRSFWSIVTAAHARVLRA
jgi:toxin ParE1/3/4